MSSDKDFEDVRKPEVASSNRGFSISNMDLTAKPNEDFYRYCVGSWLKNNPIPADKSVWGSFGQLRENNLTMLREILERCNSKGSQATDKERQLGDFYKSAMGTSAIEDLKFSPIQSQVEAIRGISSFDDLLRQISILHGFGIHALFASYSDGDMKRSTHYAFYLWQGGLSLPSKEYYLDERFLEVRKQFLEHVQRMFVLTGRGSEEAIRCASIILQMETFLAKSSRYPAELRDGEKNYNQVKVAEIDAKFPKLKLQSYLSILKIPQVDYVVVGQPEFFESIERYITERPLDDWKIYLEWNVIRSSAPYLHEEVEMEYFDFFNRKLRGQKEPEERWKRAIWVMDELVGESLGELYVKEHFGKEAEEKMSQMVEDIKDVFKDRLQHLPWMSEETKKQAIAKFERFRTKIGHPVQYRDYSSIVVKDDDYFGNVLRAMQFEVDRESQRVGKEVDKGEWLMTPQTVNAYFQPTNNEIVFPAGILQPPYFDPSIDAAVNYGGIGGVISHEITHGYDDQGRHYDLEGNLRDWWTAEDEAEFNKRAKEIVELYGTLEIFPGVRVNGELTLGENIADFGGVSIAYEALQRRLAKDHSLEKKIDGLTPSQRFFISWGQIWKSNVREQEARRRVTIDPHSPSKFRAVEPVLNHQDFEKVFDIKPEETAKHKISIW